MGAWLSEFVICDMSLVISSSECGTGVRSPADTMRALLAVGVGVGSPASLAKTHDVMVSSCKMSPSPPLSARMKQSHKLSFSVDSLLSSPSPRRGSQESPRTTPKSPTPDDQAIVYGSASDSALNLISARLQASPVQLTVRTPSMVNNLTSPSTPPAPEVRKPTAYSLLHTPPQSPLSGASGTVLTHPDTREDLSRRSGDESDGDSASSRHARPASGYDDDRFSENEEDVDIEGEDEDRGRRSSPMVRSDSEEDDGSAAAASAAAGSPGGAVPPLFPQPLHPSMMLRRPHGWPTSIPASLAAHFAWMPSGAYPPGSPAACKYHRIFFSCLLG